MVEGVRSLSKRLKLITLKQRLNNLKRPVLKKLKLSCLILHQTNRMIYSKEELQAIGDWAVDHDILILADDIYGRLVYNEHL